MLNQVAPVTAAKKESTSELLLSFVQTHIMWSIDLIDRLDDSEHCSDAPNFNGLFTFSSIIDERESNSCQLDSQRLVFHDPCQL